MKSKKKCYNFIILGFSGAGKGTQAELLARKFGMEVVDGGDYLRSLSTSKSKDALRLKKKIENGHLAPTDIIRKWLKKQILKRRKGGLIISGQPRMISEARLVCKWFAQRKERCYLRVFCLKVHEKEIVQRLEKRYVCKDCGKIYNFDNYENGKKCRVCGGALFKRPDDRPEAIRNRLKYFREQVRKTLVYFKKQGILIEINGEQPIEKVHKDILVEIAKLK